jgi:CheY-like chemotaxis protein
MSAKGIGMASGARGGSRVHPNPVLRGKRVIICDDHPTTRLALRSICQELGCAVWETGLGADAIELVEAYDPDLLVLDQLLPDMEGLAVYQALRALGIRTKVLVYTSFTRSGRFAAT